MKDKRCGDMGNRSIVSPAGSLGLVDEADSGETGIEWLYLTPADGETGLPDSTEGLSLMQG